MVDLELSCKLTSGGVIVALTKQRTVTEQKWDMCSLSRHHSSQIAKRQLDLTPLVPPPDRPPPHDQIIRCTTPSLKKKKRAIIRRLLVILGPPRSRDRRCPAQRGCGRPQADNVRGYRSTTTGRRGCPYQRRGHQYPGAGCWSGQQPARTSWKHYQPRRWSWSPQRWRRPSPTTTTRSRRVSRCSRPGLEYRSYPGCWWCNSPGPWHCQRWPRCSPGMPSGR
ncbi:hypothetical protein FJTKL_14834 [Diaporthe vaccinii]|uniref:Uncharacterized protein n=1 Tax=Diaporthe vaccinii TaxID=105482 RepID=A0ABR4F8P0_9PEZI